MKEQFILDIKHILEQALQKAYSSIASAMIEGYWKIGERIVEEEQNGKERAVYGIELIKNLSEELGKGYSGRTLRDYRQFYLTFPVWEDLAHACAKLSWSHLLQYEFKKISRCSSDIEDIKKIIEQARQKAYSATNFAMVEGYWLVGKRIVEEEQDGEERAQYGANIIKNTSKELSQNFGRGFSETNVRNFRLFYLSFPDFSQIQQTVSAKLSWSHFQLIMRVSDKNPE